MASSDAVSGNAIFYAELLASKVVEHVRDYEGVAADERLAMLELVAAKLTETVNALEADHASG